jgi:hypothetical protein
MNPCGGMRRMFHSNRKRSSAVGDFRSISVGDLASRRAMSLPSTGRAFLNCEGRVLQSNRLATGKD